MSGEYMMQPFNALSLPVLSITFLCALNFLNTISTVFVISDIEPIEVEFIPDNLRIFNKEPRSRGCEVSILCSIF